MSIKTYYHGTVAAFLPAIKREGLKPDMKHAWKIHFDHYGDLRPPNDQKHDPAVFLSTTQKHATAYAQTRADYFQRKPGECFAMYGSTPADYLYLNKDDDAPVLHTVPALVVVQLDSTKFTLENDPEDWTSAVMSFKPIPPSAIIHIEHLSPKFNPAPAVPEKDPLAWLGAI